MVFKIIVLFFFITNIQAAESGDCAAEQDPAKRAACEKEMAAQKKEQSLLKNAVKGGKQLTGQKQGEEKSSEETAKSIAGNGNGGLNEKDQAIIEESKKYGSCGDGNCNFINTAKDRGAANGAQLAAVDQTGHNFVEDNATKFGNEAKAQDVANEMLNNIDNKTVEGGIKESVTGQLGVVQKAKYATNGDKPLPSGMEAQYAVDYQGQEFKLRTPVGGISPNQLAEKP